MKKMPMVIIMICTLGVVPVGGAYGSERGKECQPSDARMERRMETMDKALGLSPEQKEKLKTNRTAQETKIKALREAGKEKKQALAEALKNPATTRADITPIVSDLKAIQNQITDNRIDGIFAVKEILTPEQFKTFQERMAKEMSEHKRHRRGQPDPSMMPND